jgi:hypothetical protein
MPSFVENTKKKIRSLKNSCKKKRNLGNHCKNWERSLILNYKSKKKYLSKRRRRQKRRSKEEWNLFKKSFKSIIIVKK